ncbi:MAG: hypothetical protein ACTHNB_06505 [Gaiellaceae bacterium]
MRKLILVLFTAFLAIPALAVAGSPPSPADSAAAQKQCRAELNAMGAPAFKLLFANKANAFGKCVSTRASQNAANRANAAAQCTSARTADPAGFAAKYGSGPNHKNAFNRCVSLTSKAIAAAQVTATINASKQCLAERKAGLAAFKAKYGAKNSFGKCVSSKVKHSG